MPNGTLVTTDGPAGSKEKCWNSGIHWAQGRDCASARAAAPTVVMSISSASGSTSAIARRRSGTSWVARVAKVASAFARPPPALPLRSRQAAPARSPGRPARRGGRAPGGSRPRRQASGRGSRDRGRGAPAASARVGRGAHGRARCRPGTGSSQVSFQELDQVDERAFGLGPAEP